MSDESDEPGTADDSGAPTGVGGRTASAPPSGPGQLSTDDEGVTRSALVGFMSVPVHARFPIRRSTLLMTLAFIGLATVLVFNPPNSTTSTGTGTVIQTPSGPIYVPNATPVSTTTTTTTVPPTTTTTTQGPTTSTTTRPNGSTSTTSSAPVVSTTTTGAAGSGTGGSGSGTTTTTTTLAPGTTRGGGSTTTTATTATTAVTPAP